MKKKYATKYRGAFRRGGGGGLLVLPCQKGGGVVVGEGGGGCLTLTKTTFYCWTKSTLEMQWTNVLKRFDIFYI